MLGCFEGLLDLRFYFRGLRVIVIIFLLRVIVKGSLWVINLHCLSSSLVILSQFMLIEVRMSILFIEVFSMLQNPRWLVRVYHF